MISQSTRRARLIPPALFGVAFAIAALSPAQSALPPAEKVDLEGKKSPVERGALPESQGDDGWTLPPLRIGGRLVYNYSRDMDAQSSGLQAVVGAQTSLYIWQPWFATLSGNLEVSSDRLVNGHADTNNTNSNANVLGRVDLSVLPKSAFPFTAYIHRQNSRASDDLTASSQSVGQGFGFEQRVVMEKGDASLAWNRQSNESAGSGRTSQDDLTLRMTQKLELHRFDFLAQRSAQSQNESNQSAIVTSINLQHGYEPNDAISVQNLVNVSQSKYELTAGSSDARLSQVSSSVFWRPAKKGLSVVGGVRAYVVDSGQTSSPIVGSSNTNHFLNTNVNLGIGYEFDRFTYVDASANVNHVENNGQKSLNFAQIVNASYRPDHKELGPFRYHWSTNAGASNRGNADVAEKSVELRFSHGLNRDFKMAGGSSMAVGISQNLALRRRFGNTSGSGGEVAHSADLSWTLPHATGSSYFAVTATDSRVFDEPRSAFQMLNLQASSNVPVGEHGSLSGNLTMQAVRQYTSTLDNNRVSDNAGSNTRGNGAVTTFSSGSIAFNNRQFFGVRRLNFSSNLRLNGQALLPLFGSVKDQEDAAWENRLDYAIGRTRFQALFQISSLGTPMNAIDPITGVQSVERVRKLNRSIMFSVTRSFGSY